MSKAKIYRRALMQGGSVVLNKDLIRAIGLDAALLYSELCSKEEYFERRGDLTEDGFFFNTIENMEKDTTLSRYQQDKAIKLLVKLNLIEFEKRGMPAVRYFRVMDNDEIFNVVSAVNIDNNIAKNSQTDMQKTNKLTCKKLAPNNTKKNNNLKSKYKNTNNIYIGESALNYKQEAKSSPTKPVSLDNIITELDAVEKPRDIKQLEKDYQVKIKKRLATKSKDFLEALTEFENMRNSIKKKLTIGGLKRTLDDLDRIAPDDEAHQIELLLKSVDNKWIGIWNNTKSPPPNKEYSTFATGILK